MLITRKQIRMLRSVFRRLGGRGHSRADAVVYFRADRNGLRVQCVWEKFALERRFKMPDSTAEFALPLTALADFEGSNESPVTFLPNDEQTVVEWTHNQLPQRRCYEPVSPDKEVGFKLPQETASFVDNSLFPSLAEVASCCADNPTRYALTCIQLGGNTGEAVATDGSQLLISGGFQFPWTDDVLVHRSAVLSSRELADAGPAEIGRTDEHVVFQTGTWTLWLPIEKDGRFPKVESVAPDARHAPTVARLSGEDAAFLAQSLSSLPGGTEPHAPVTLHCNGEVVVRAKDEHSPITELALVGSHVEGQEILFNTDRHYLQRAALLGLTDVRLWSAKAAILCSDASRRYIWMPLDAESAVRPSPNAIRIESPNASSRTTSKSRVERKEALVKVNPAEAPATRISPPDAAKSEEPIGDPLREAETLKTQLRETLGQVSRLIASLKRQRKQAQLVRATLTSLKQLQQVG